MRECKGYNEKKRGEIVKEREGNWEKEGDKVREREGNSERKRET